MSTHIATVSWSRGDQPFVDKKYARAHTWAFDGGAVVRGSSAPSAVRPPMSDPAGVDPEEAVVAAASSCHMMWFLALAAGQGLVVDSYTDQAVGTLGSDPTSGCAYLTRIEMHPAIVFSGRQPGKDEVAALHHEAHTRCYVANSLKTEIVVVDD